MIYKIFLPKISPFSINNAYYQNRTLTREARIWRAQVFQALRQKANQLVMDEVNKNFDGKIHALSVAYSFGIPNLITKKGSISKTSSDLSNIEKLLQDCIFDERFREDGRLRNCGINDAYIVKLRSEKILSTTHGVCVRIEILNLREV